MSLTENGNGMVMPVAPAYGGYGYGGGSAFGGDWGSWIILFLIAAMWGGFGNGGFGGGFGGGYEFPWLFNGQSGINANTNAGFNQAATQSGLAGIQTSLTTGFSNAEVSACNRAMDAMQTSYTNQIASMNQSFANQQALDSRLYAMQSAQAECCCENRLGLANLGADIAREACADRAAVTSALRDVLEANTASTQRILDTMCQDKIDAKNEKIADLQNQLTMANLAASQSRQTQDIENFVRPQINPAYIVPNPYAYNFLNNGYSGCGCAGYVG